MSRRRTLAFVLAASFLTVGFAWVWPLVDGAFRDLSVRRDATFAGDVTYSGTFYQERHLTATAAKVGGMKMPDWSKVADDGAGSGGVYAYCFDKAAEEELFFTVKLPPGRLPNSDLGTHAHWMAIDSGAGGVVWGVECSPMADSGESLSPTSSTETTGTAPGAALVHVMTDLPDFPGAGVGPEAISLCRVYRAAGLAADTYDNDACLLAWGPFYRVGRPGATAECVH